MSEVNATGAEDHAQILRLAERLAADTGRDIDDTVRLVRAIDRDEVDPAEVFELIAPTAQALLGTGLAHLLDDTLARAGQLPEDRRGPALAPIVQTLLPAVAQAVLAEGGSRAGS